MHARQKRTPAVQTPASQIPRLVTKVTERTQYTTIRPSLQLAASYARVGPGSWRHIAVPTARVVGCLFVGHAL